MRLLAASLLSMGVILLWTKFFAPKPPVSLNKSGSTAQTGPATAGSTSGAANGAATTGPGTTSMAPAKGTANVAGGLGAAATGMPSSIAVKADTQEHTVVVENDLYRVVF